MAIDPVLTAHGHPPIAPQQDAQRKELADLVNEFQELLQQYDPPSVAHARSILLEYEGMERDVIQCYRSHYTRTLMFAVPLRTQEEDTDDSSVGDVAAATFELPPLAIAEFLREKKKRQRAHSADYALKGEGLRNAEGCRMRGSRMAIARRRAVSLDAAAPAVRPVIPRVSTDMAVTTSRQLPPRPRVRQQEEHAQGPGLTSPREQGTPIHAHAHGPAVSVYQTPERHSG